jgi:hypothetical protein
MSKIYWEKNKNNCSSKPIIGNNQATGDAIIIGRQLSDGLNEVERQKLNGIEEYAQVNIIESIEINSEKQTVDENKAVNIFIPTKLSELINDKNFIDSITTDQVKAAIGEEVAFKPDFVITEEQWNSFNWDFKEDSEVPQPPVEEIEETKEEI